MPLTNTAHGHAACFITTKGLVSDVMILVPLNANGTIATMAGDASGGSFGMRAPWAEFLNQFIGKSLPVEDMLSGATATSTAVIEAVNSLAE